jgi:multiple antibiotic resistance protein
MTLIMLETGLVAFAAFFTTIDPIGVAVIFAAITSGSTGSQRRTMAFRGTGIAAGLLLVFALFGDPLLKYMGITLPALRIAGGILLLLMAIDMVFARTSGGRVTTEPEEEEAELKQDISVFPLATPLIAGPGAMGAGILLVAQAEGDPVLEAIVIGALAAVLAINLVLMFVATQVQRILGVTGLNVVARVMGILLAALAVQFILDGLGRQRPAFLNGARSALRRALEFDHVAVGVLDVDRGPEFLRPVAALEGARIDAVAVQVGADGGLVEGIDSQAKVIHVAPLRPGRGAAHAAEFPRRIHQVDQGPPGAQLDEADGRLIAFHRAAENVAVEELQSLGVRRPDDDVVDPRGPEGRSHSNEPGFVSGGLFPGILPCR